MKVISCWIGLCCLLATSMQAEEHSWSLYLVGASRGPAPVIVTVQTSGAQVSDHLITAPYGDPSRVVRRGSAGSQGFYAPAEGQVQGWQVGRDQLQFQVSGRFAAADAVAVQAQVQARIEGGRLTGSWQGQGTDGSSGGQVIGWRRPSPGLVDGSPVTLVLEGPRSNWSGRSDVLITFAVAGGQATNVHVSGGAKGSAYNTSKYPCPVVPAVGDDGRPLHVLTTGAFAFEELLSSRVTANAVELQMRLSGDVAGTFTITARRVGQQLIGQYQVNDTTRAVHGVFGPAQATALAQPRGASPGDRLLRALLWAYISPEMGGIWSSDAIAAGAVGTSEKQYDNFFENAYGGMAAMSLLARLAADPDLAHEARLRALRAGWAMHTRGILHDGLTHYYKNMFWLAAWGPMGCLDLYALTQDRLWLDRATTFARTLERLQMPEGTWTYFNEQTGSSGKSNERHNRSYDNRPLACGEFLLFLGRLRVEAGVSDFQAVEERAAAWMLAAFRSDPQALFRDRRPGEIQEARNAVYLARYLAQYAGAGQQAAAREVVAYIEQHFMGAIPSDLPGVQGFSPAVIDYYPRWGMNDRPAPATASSSGLALAYQALGDARKAQALVNAVFARQTPEGLIHHLGRTDLPVDHEQRIKNGGPDQHQMTGMRAETLDNLQRWLQLSQGR